MTLIAFWFVFFLSLGRPLLTLFFFFIVCCQLLSVYVSILFRLASLAVSLRLSFWPYFSVPACVCLLLSAELSSSVRLSSVSPDQSLLSLRNVFDCLPAFSVLLSLPLALFYGPLWLCLFLLFSSHLSDSQFSFSLFLFISTPFFSLPVGFICILSQFLLCPSFRLRCLCSLCFYCLARLQEVMGAKCLYSQWQDGPYKSTELIDVMYDTLRDCFGKE